MSSALSPFEFGKELFPFRVSVEGGTSFETGINDEKLGGDWAVGTEFHVTDGFVVSGATGGNGLFVANGTSGGKPQYIIVPNDDTGDGPTTVYYDGTTWQFLSPANNNYQANDGNEAFPWLADWELISPLTLTHPAVQTRIAASTAQGGVAVIGGTQDGVYKFNGDLNNGRPASELLANTDFHIRWNEDDFTPGRWTVVDTTGPTLIYYSESDVSTPDLASNWMTADDHAAPITVTSVSLGEIYAGLRITNDGSTNGSSYVSAPFHGRQYYMGLNGGGSNNMHWDTDFGVWTDDAGAWTTSNVAFPWQGTDNGGGHTGATFAKNDVANEANWENS